MRIGIVKNIIGTAIARDAKNNERILSVGDEIVLGESVITQGIDSKAIVMLEGGKELVVQGSDAVKIDQSVAFGDSFGSESAVEVAALQKALAQGQDIAELGETAAGEGAQGTGQLNDSVFDESGHESNIYTNSINFGINDNTVVDDTGAFANNNIEDAISPTIVSITVSGMANETVDNIFNSKESGIVTIVFSEKISGLDLSDLSVVDEAGNVLKNIVISELVTADNIHFTVILTPEIGIELSGLKVIIAEGTYMDAAGNLGASAQSNIFDVDTLAPVVSVNTISFEDDGKCTIRGTVDDVTITNVVLSKQDGTYLGTSTVSDGMFELVGYDSILEKGDVVVAKAVDYAGNIGLGNKEVVTIYPTLDATPKVRGDFGDKIAFDVQGMIQDAGPNDVLSISIDVGDAKCKLYYKNDSGGYSEIQPNGDGKTYSIDILNLSKLHIAPLNEQGDKAFDITIRAVATNTLTGDRAETSKTMIVAGFNSEDNLGAEDLVGNWLYGYSGDDSIGLENLTNVFVNGGNGADAIVIKNSSDMHIQGGDGNDEINLANSSDTYVYGQKGDDEISIENSKKVTIYGGAEDSGIDKIAIVDSEEVTAYGGAGDDLITAYQSKQLVLEGGAGNDVINVKDSSYITVNGGYDDDLIEVENTQNIKIYGSNGNDKIIIDSLNSIECIDGGINIDTLVLKDAKLDLTQFENLNARINSIEVIDLSSIGANVLTLNAASILAITDNKNTILKVVGDGNDSLFVQGDTWRKSSDSNVESGYTRFETGSGSSLLKIDVKDTLPALFGNISCTEYNRNAMENLFFNPKALSNDAVKFIVDTQNKAVLNKGIDNNDGTYTLTRNELVGLKVFPYKDEASEELRPRADVDAPLRVTIKALVGEEYSVEKSTTFTGFNSEVITSKDLIDLNFRVPTSFGGTVYCYEGDDLVTIIDNRQYLNILDLGAGDDVVYIENRLGVEGGNIDNIYTGSGNNAITLKNMFAGVDIRCEAGSVNTIKVLENSQNVTVWDYGSKGNDIEVKDSQLGRFYTSS